MGGPKKAKKHADVLLEWFLSTFSPIFDKVCTIVCNFINGPNYRNLAFY